MRILLACEFYHPSVGGVQEVMRQVGERLVARGHDVTVATSRLPERTSLEHNGVKIVEFAISGNAVRGFRGDVAAYRRYLTENDVDVVMVKAAQQWTFDAMIPALDAIRTPKVFIPCGFSGLYEPAYRDYFEKMPAILGRFDHLIFYASDYRDVNMAREHGLTNFSIVPNGASEVEFGVARDPGFRKRNGIPDDAFLVLTVGRLGVLKGHWEVAEAFELAQFGDRPAALILNGLIEPPIPETLRVRLMNAGKMTMATLRTPLGYVKRFVLRLPPRPRSRPPIHELVARINLAAPAKSAAILDLPRPELVQAYLNSDLFVFASHVEYSPLVLFEAAAAGLPFVTVPAGNSAEIAAWTGGGVVCPAPQDRRGYTQVDPAVLAGRITELAANAAERDALGRRGHEAWARAFTWNSITDRYEAILREAAARRRA